ncbi:genetic competence negative regulator [Aquibacillus sp. 3ASR75-11]|uniref:Adapter protein MecA n=1 Tax=Terrihalobacillus insolitus TaxID=2950438 RepID=A0A9X3WWX8_9BACI|nr:genetic competence negative regulator [Terrihalobacillus insolitus]MDC3413077.1 genetic competence negative regulator [Terrihalobacillus insolitus]MDC3424819.1 genetic competence negative regulator [Terrihalobacillus insolitus]
MRLERLSGDQFKIFLTFDDLIERGLTKEDLWHDLPRVHQLFHDMMYEASDELGIELEGVLLVQVHLLQAQGMLIIVTRNKQIEDDYDDEFVEMQVTLDESRELIFLFKDFENIIQLCSHLHELGIIGGAIYHMNNLYYMEMKDLDVAGQNREHIIAIMSEFGSPSVVTSHRLMEYGIQIMEKEATKKIVEYF